jgi:hypothetical protein
MVAYTGLLCCFAVDGYVRVDTGSDKMDLIGVGDDVHAKSEEDTRGQSIMQQ